MKLTFRTATIGALSLLPLIASAQLVPTGTSYGFNQGNGFFTSFDRSGDGVVVSGNDFTLTGSGHQTFEPDVATDGIASGIIDSYFNFRVGETPVQLSNPTWNLNGKGVVTNYTSDDQFYVDFQWTLYEFVDDNSNNVWDPSEIRYSLLTSADPTTVFVTGSGLEVYNSPEDFSSLDNFLLGADGHFLLTAQDRMTFVYGVDPTAPPIHGTSETDNTYTGDVLGFTATPVPEPASLFTLAIGAAALLRRRRKRA